MNEKSILKVMEATGKMITELELKIYLMETDVEDLTKENASLKQQVLDMKRSKNI